MRTLEQIMRAERPEQRRQRVEQLAAAFGACAGAANPLWQALTSCFERYIAECNDLGTQPGEENRTFYNGGERMARDLYQELDDLRTGAWKDWPEFARQQRRKPEDGEDDKE